MALNVDTPELFSTSSVTFLQKNNKSFERMYQDILLEFRQFDKNYKKFEQSITEKIRQWQQ